MARSSTEQKWLERRRHHNEQVWDFQCSRQMYARAWHPLYCEGDAMEVECEWPTPLSIYRCSTYRKEIVRQRHVAEIEGCLLYTSDAADERSSVDLGGRRIIKKKRN